MSTANPITPKNNTLAMASLIVGILALAGFAILGAGFGGIIGIVAIVLGVIALNQIKKQGGQGKNLAMIGIALGGLSLAIWVIGLIVAPMIDDTFNNITDALGG